MTNTVDILGSEVSIKEYKGQRVVTLKDIDTVHKRPEGTARKRFNDNKKHFIDGIDYFKVKCSEVRPFFGQTLPNGFNPDSDLILVTEIGYLMIVKSFKDDLAWEIQRYLVNTYFKAKKFGRDTNQNLCAYAQAKDRIALWKRKVSNPLIERIIVLIDVDDFVSAYAYVYKAMRKSYGFDMNKAKFDYCQRYNVAYENCSVIDCVADDNELRSAFELCAIKSIKDLSEDRLVSVERIAERKIREAKEFVAYSEEVIQKAVQSSQILDEQLAKIDSECNCLV